ncbi:metal ABC transporter substrate-binding protein [Brochothrix campestris]|uniref:Manganese ABC transporter substrate-binding protein n=1 Tax=Brochothrix campestris FSL F6-1037 TaxID=1265861 RepID=W7D7N4_9LIST|nr:metal ABC transporter substrate-binding protein [Brochothrix campestris]EUJ41368.1 manganese ABC transporter substrate-binding protein [Brochothrix campestris FSL F6-1037]
MTFKKKTAGLLIVIACLTLLLTGCASSKTAETAADKMQVVVTNSILKDMVEQVGGEHVSVHSIVPVGQDPHEYEPLPIDTAKTAAAALIFYNGLNLEVGNGWFTKLLDSTQQKDKENEVTFAVSKGIKAITLNGKKEKDPHAWLDINNGMRYIDNITAVLAQKDPTHKDSYQKKATAYKDKLTKVDQQARMKLATIPTERAVLITSEGAFKYFSKAYGLKSEYIWEINSENEGTPAQLTRIIDLTRATKIPKLFVETSVNPKSMATLSQETKVPINEGKLYTDSLGVQGSSGATYLAMMEWNITQIYEGLK